MMAAMFRLDEQSQMVATMVRGWGTSQLAPKIPALEHRTGRPVGLRKKMPKACGFDAMLGASVQKRIAKLRAGEDSAASAEKTLAAGIGNPMMMHVVVKELSRVSPR